KTYPALDVRAASTDLLLVLIADFAPTAVEEDGDVVRVFFSRAADREAARLALAPRFPVASIDVPDEDWARRSQEDLRPITIGRLTIFPTSEFLVPSPESLSSNPKSLTPNPCSIVIPPSMAFGTGHHATTQLCLE